MAAADPPAGLLDIASTLAQDEIPFKLRCAICNKLAVNAFRLPCCDQSICESCQTSLPNSCPVCAHTPVSPDLCKPNKALRTTLKAFLRTEEKKREKERQLAAATPTPASETPAQSEVPPSEATPDQNGTIEKSPSTQVADAPQPDILTSDKVHREDTLVESKQPDNGHANEYSETAQPTAEPEVAGQPSEAAPAVEENTESNEPETVLDPNALPSAEKNQQQPNGNVMNMGQAGFPGMGWNGMNPFMSNMFNFQNPMGMPMSMDPMAANQGMFGDYGMNMAGMGMGMGMGMNYNGQGMYGSSEWNGSWQTPQDNYNPNAFANGTGPQHGGAFGGPNMSYPSNPDYQSGYYGPGYGRGGFRGAARGGYGGFAPAHPSHGPSQETPNGVVNSTDETNINGDNSHPNENGGLDQVSQESTTKGDSVSKDDQGAVGQQLQGIPTIESLDQSMANGPPGPGWQGPGYGRGGFRGPVGHGGGYWGGPMPSAGAYHQPSMPPKPPVVEGAPAAPRGMRQGLPNTSMLRQRAFQQARVSGGNSTPVMLQAENSEPPQDHTRPVSPAHQSPQAQQSGMEPRSRSPSVSRNSRARSTTANPFEIDVSNLRGSESKHPDTRHERAANESRSLGDEDHESERGGRRDEYRSRRSNGHRSRANSRSPVRNSDSRSSRLATMTEDRQLNRSKESAKTDDSRNLASRVSSHRSGKERHDRREEDRDRDRDRDRARPSRRRERDRDRDSDRDRRRDREKDRDRERVRQRDHERERDRDRDRDRGRSDRDRDRQRDRKRARRDRSESANASDHSSHPRARRLKRETNNDRRDRPSSRSRPDKEKTREKEKGREKEKEKEKDPYTLAREAANRERVLREQQNREVKSQPKSSRRDSRQDRLVGGRRINFKYEDEL